MKHELLDLVDTVYRETGDFCTMELMPEMRIKAAVVTYVASREHHDNHSANGESTVKGHTTIEEAVDYLKTYLKEYSND